ncbi:hypothetical protein H2200_003656 [Cladophialophora chaetospira]|uniref:Uncharacterized protein n=1 Tax=Cladophialophora chaetospira TaxID=386627 RepID=A0AA38XFB1_9EURO|nr:hypothetical protein H2200_003656 [Cladophialophora chaetospira]
MPAPDTTPYAQHQPYIPQVQAVPPPPAATGRSIFIRFTRSIFWAILFSSFGIVAGTGLITWEYLQPPFEPGSEPEQDLLDEIADAIDLHPLVDSLQQANWIEDNYYAAFPSRLDSIGANGMHLVAEKLSGTQGITMKTFRHPTQEFTIMVAFLGFGIEGWPDVIHGGIITTLIQEGIDRQLLNFYQKYGNQHAQAISVDFKRRMRPGEVYAVVVPPAQVEMHPPQKEVMHLQMTPMVVRIEFPPRITPEALTIELPSMEELHAVANVQVRLVQQDVTPERMAELEAGFASQKIENN